MLNDVLWPDGAPSPNALQALVSKLRKSIAPMTIDATGTSYTLVLGRGVIDAHRFEQLVTAGREAAAAGRPESAVTHLDVALALWRARPYGRARTALADSGFEAAFAAGAADPDTEIVRCRQRAVSA
ncbi:MAG: BTAD domain-containing putative transcriptional regulator [Ilumatobacteraceae bacterium]